MKEVMYFWSWLFSPRVALVLFVTLSLLLLTKKRVRDAITVGLAGASTFGVVALVKQAVNRGRPHYDATLWATDPSFPSGHAAASACFAILVTWFFTHPHHRMKVGLATGALALLVGASRLYFHLHYVTDVIAGYLVGIGMALSAVYVDRRGKLR